MTTSIRPPRALARALALLALALAVLAAPARAADDPAVVARDLQKIVRASGLGTSASVTVATAAGRPIYHVRGTVSRLPASNQKLVSMLAILSRIGPDARLSTTVVAPGNVVGGELRSSLFLVGGGDPMLSTRDFARVRYRVPVATLDDLALRVRRAGIRRVTGGIVGDGSMYDRLRGGPAWKPGFLPYECAPLSALSVNRNESARGTVWTPELTAARLFKQALARRGVRVEGAARVGVAPESSRLIAAQPSPPLATVIRLMGKDSDNFTAEMLLKAVGAYADGRGSTRAGARVAHDELVAREVPVAGVVTADGSGLSLRDRVTTDALAELLGAAARDPAIARPLRDALAIGGVDGTLRSRLTSTGGRVHAKTGTLDEASSLSGYVGRYVFSVIVNAPVVDHSRAHALQDAVAERLARA